MVAGDSAYFRKKKTKYVFSYENCIGMSCFSPGSYQHRSMLPDGQGSRNTGGNTRCCIHNMYHGCPDNRQYDKDLAKKRKKEGWVMFT